MKTLIWQVTDTMTLIQLFLIGLSGLMSSQQNNFVPCFSRDDVIKTQILRHCSRLFLGEFYKIFVQLCNGQIDFLRNTISSRQLGQAPANSRDPEGGRKRLQKMDGRENILSHAFAAVCASKYIYHPKLKNVCISNALLLKVTDLCLLSPMRKQKKCSCWPVWLR